MERNTDALIICLKLSDGEFAEWSEREATDVIEDALVDVFSAGALGEFDGHEFGGGFATLFMYGPSADQMAEAVIPVLNGFFLKDGSVLIKRFGPPGSREESSARGSDSVTKRRRRCRSRVPAQTRSSQ
jgi:hypothetical protein